MTKLYYTSAEEAAAQLGLPLLLAAASSVAVPRLGLRLSDHAPDTVLGARLYHRLNITETTEPLVLWVVSPHETAEHIGWAVGVAEHAARTGKTSYIFDLDRSSAMRALVSGDGHPLPSPVRERLERLLVRAAAVWSSDLQGVRIVLPVVRVPKGDTMETPANWVLVIASALPESPQDIRRIAKEADGVILAAGIRDHPRQELETVVSALSKGGASMLGLVAMGPVPRKGTAPLDRWTEPDHLKPGVPKEKPIRPDVPEPEETVVAARQSETDEPEWETEPVHEERPAASVPSSIDLVAGWQSRTEPKKRSARWLLPVVLVAAAVAGIGLLVTNHEKLPLVSKKQGTAAVADSGQVATQKGSVATEEGSAAEVLESGERGEPHVLEGLDSMIAYARVISEEDLSDSFWTGIEPPGATAELEGEEAEWIDTSSPEEPDSTEMAAAFLDREPAATPATESIAKFSELDADEPTRAVTEETPERGTETAEGRGPEAVEPSTGTKPVPALPDTAVREEPRLPREPFGVPAPEDTTREQTIVWPDTFVVHVSSFNVRIDAESEIARLKRAGFAARMVPVIIAGKGRWVRVVLGSYSSSDAAAAAAADIRARGLATFAQVLGHGGVGGDRRAVMP